MNRRMPSERCVRASITLRPERLRLFERDLQDALMESPRLIFLVGFLVGLSMPIRASIRKRELKS